MEIYSLEDKKNFIKELVKYLKGVPVEQEEKIKKLEEKSEETEEIEEKLKKVEKALETLGVSEKSEEILKILGISEKVEKSEEKVNEKKLRQEFVKYFGESFEIEGTEKTIVEVVAEIEQLQLNLTDDKEIEEIVKLTSGITHHLQGFYNYSLKEIFKNRREIATDVINKINDYILDSRTDKVIEKDDLVELIEQLIELDNNSVYRGEVTYSGNKGELLSGIYRPDKADIEEREMINSAISTYPNEFKDVTSNLEVLLKLQHYEIPTRLLDISYSPYIPLYFACKKSDNREKKAGYFYIIDTKDLEKKTVFSDKLALLSSIARLKSSEQKDLKKEILSLLLLGIKNISERIDEKIEETIRNANISEKIEISELESMQKEQLVEIEKQLEKIGKLKKEKELKELKELKEQLEKQKKNIEKQKETTKKIKKGHERIKEFIELEGDEFKSKMKKENDKSIKKLEKIKEEIKVSVTVRDLIGRVSIQRISSLEYINLYNDHAFIIEEEMGIIDFSSPYIYIDDYLNDYEEYKSLFNSIFRKVYEENKQKFPILESLIHEVRRFQPGFTERIVITDLLKDYLISSHNSNPRITNQKGGFILTGENGDSKAISKANHVKEIWKIEPEAMDEILDYLETMGINESYVYPELQKFDYRKYTKE